MPFRSMSARYIDQLTFHIILGFFALALVLVAAFYRFKLVLGLTSTLIKIPIYILLLISSFLPITGAMIIGWTSFLLFVDWRLTKRRLRKIGYDAVKLKQARWTYLDFAILLQALLSGWFITVACLSFMLIYHQIHGLTLPLLALWFTLRNVWRLGFRSRIAITVLLVLFLALVGNWYIRKQVLRGDENDPKYPDVHQTVERMAERHKLKPMSESSLNGSQGCSGYGCHTIIVDQWRGSSHRFSVNNAFFRKVCQRYLELEGPEYVRTCINCHDPVAAMSPDAEEKYLTGKIDNPEGISCKACHIITNYHPQRGNGLYTMKAPASYPFDQRLEDQSKERAYYKRAIHMDPRLHVRNYRRKAYYRSSEYCITCHNVIVPEETTGGKPLHLHTLFKQWRNSEWSKYLNCVDCHLPRFQMDENGYVFFDHRILGSNMDLLQTADAPAAERGYVEDFSQFSRRYLDGDLRYNTYEVVANPAWYKFRKNPNRKLSLATFFTWYELKRFLEAMYFLGGGPIIDLEARVEDRLTPEGALQIGTKTTNVRVGHDFPSGPIDVQEIWLEAVLKDRSGKVVAQTGGLDDKHYLAATAPILGSRGILDAQGRPLLYHEFWKAAQVVDKTVLAPFQSVEHGLQLQLPALPDGVYALTVRWNFRRMNQRLVDWVWPEQHQTLPVTILDFSEFQVKVGRDAENKISCETQLVNRPPRKSFSSLDQMFKRSFDEFKNI